MLIENQKKHLTDLVTQIGRISKTRGNRTTAEMILGICCQIEQEEIRPLVEMAIDACPCVIRNPCLMPECRLAQAVLDKYGTDDDLARWLIKHESYAVVPPMGDTTVYAVGVLPSDGSSP